MKLILATVAVAIALQAIPFSTVCVAEDKEEAKRVELTGSFKEHKTLEVQFIDEDGTKYNVVKKQREKASNFIGEKVDIVAKVKPGKIEGNTLIVYLGKITKVSDSQ